MSELDGRVNNLLNNNHQLVVNRLPRASFKTTRVRLPGFAFQTTGLDFPNTTLNIPGMKFVPDPVTVTAIVDEDMSNYFEVLKWLIRCRHYDEDQLVSDVLEDFTINILDNHGNSSVSFRYQGGFIQSLDGLDLTSDVSDTENTKVTFTLFYQSVSIDQFRGDDTNEVIKLHV